MIALENWVECPECHEEQLVLFRFPNCDTPQEITDDDVHPVPVRCEQGHEFQAQYDGWHSHDDAG